MTRRVVSVLMALLMAAGLTALASGSAQARPVTQALSAQAAIPNGPPLNVQPPFVGTFDRFGIAGPYRNHHRVTGGDWAADLYASPGTAVQARAWPVSQQGAVQYRVAERKSACRNASDGGGEAVKVEFHYACFFGNPNNPIVFWGVIGRIGGHYANGYQARCP